MVDKLWVVGIFGSISGSLLWLSMTAQPNKGFMRIIEGICSGAVLCWLCGLMGRLLGINIAQSPLAALSAGFLGLPGVALSTVLALWP